MIDVVERFLALLALVALLVAVTGVGLLVTRRVPRWLGEEVALFLAAAIAVVATAGSLFASEVAGYPPCPLCWYQRAAMYPLAVVLTVAAVRRRAGVWRLGLPVAILGATVASYHVVLERRPAAPTALCTPDAPCSVRWIEEFGVLTLPSMALIGFVAIGVLLLVARATDARRRGREDDEATSQPVRDPRGARP